MDSGKKRLRGYIPLAAPLNWEPATGSEPALRTLMSFTTNWFAKRVDIDFSERYHTDPVYRFENIYKMKKYIRRTFPDIPYFQEHDGDGFEQECATLSGIFGVCLVAMVYGLKIIYSKSNWPAVDPASHLSVAEIKKLKPFDLSANPAVDQLSKQMDIISDRWGKIDGYLNYQGVLNNAFKIRGTDILMDMLDDPGLAHFLFDHITDTMTKLISMVQKRQRDSGFLINGTSTSNCVVNMISPEYYEEFVLPYDKKLSDAFECFGIHSCNWAVDPYVRSFKKAGNVGYIDFGFSSDLAKVREVFPDATREVFYNPAFLTMKSDAQVRQDIEMVYRKLAPCELCLPDIDDFVPDEKISAFIRATEQVSGG